MIICFVCRNYLGLICNYNKWFHITYYLSKYHTNVIDLYLKRMLFRRHIGNIAAVDAALSSHDNKERCRFHCQQWRITCQLPRKADLFPWRSLRSQLSGRLASICGVVIALLTWCTPVDELSIMFYEIFDDCFLLLPWGAEAFGRSVIYLPAGSLKWVELMITGMRLQHFCEASRVVD